MPLGSDREGLDRARPALIELAKAAVAEWCAGAGRLSEVSTASDTGSSATLLLTLSQPARRLVLKVAPPTPETPVDFGRTAAAAALARAAGVPVPQTLGVDCTARLSRWQCLLLEHVPGLEWFRVRSQLDQAQAYAAGRQIAATVLALQSVPMASFGELDRSGRPKPMGLVSALRQRAELRIADPRRRDLFLDVLQRDAALFETPAADSPATLTHDDLHPGNLVWQLGPEGWRLAAVLDWDKAWAGPAESDVARMAFWDDMTGPGFWDSYRRAVPAAPGQPERALIHQLLWCLEYEARTERHLRDTSTLCRRLGVPVPA